MDARIVITPDGKIALFIDEGTFAQAAALSRALLQKLNADLDIALVVAEPEQHRHGPQGEHVHAGGALVHSH